jgi:hypothetical protein
MTVTPTTTTRTPVYYRTPVTIEEVERVNRWLEKQIEAKIEAAFRLARRWSVRTVKLP